MITAPSFDYHFYFRLKTCKNTCLYVILNRAFIFHKIVFKSNERSKYSYPGLADFFFRKKS